MSGDPTWLSDVKSALESVTEFPIARFAPPADFQGRESAVLIALSDWNGTPEMVVIQRSFSLRKHAGQAAFPGGAVDDTDADVVAAALREAQEEIGLDPSSVAVLGTLPRVWVPVSGFAVTPVVAHWHTPHEISPQDLAEVAAVHRISVAELVSPENRVRVQHSSGFVGPGFLIDELTIWGFTGALLDAILQWFGWEEPWKPGPLIELAAREPRQDSSKDLS